MGLWVRQRAEVEVQIAGQGEDVLDVLLVHHQQGIVDGIIGGRFRQPNHTRISFRVPTGRALRLIFLLLLPTPILT